MTSHNQPALPFPQDQRPTIKPFPVALDRFYVFGDIRRRNKAPCAIVEPSIKFPGFAYVTVVGKRETATSRDMVNQAFLGTWLEHDGVDLSDVEALPFDGIPRAWLMAEYGDQDHLAIEAARNAKK
ncbi:MAG: hypothetical protein GX442_13690 [Candidatus Riflebacteria bacterium]|nr:hypothetical protein [Candidatus Riflebacteria bacterium]